MFANIIKRKAELILKPIAEIIITPEQGKYVTPEAFFNHTVLHELSHTLGPSYRLNDGKTTVKSCLEDLYPAIEEAKADTLAIWSMMRLREMGFYSQEDVLEGHITQVASMFRSMRFGLGSAHARANMIQLRWMIEKGGLELTDKGFMAHFDAFEKGVLSLSKELLETKLYGDYNRAKHIMDTYSEPDERITDIMARLKNIPIDITV